MDWKKRFAENPDHIGDPVAALWQPSGFVIAHSIPLASYAMGWIARLALGAAGAAFARKIDPDVAHSNTVLRRHMERVQAIEAARRLETDGRGFVDLPKPLISTLVIMWVNGTLGLHAFRSMPFMSSVSVTIRIYDPRRDGKPEGPPAVGIEWRTVGPGRDETLRIPETFAAAIHDCSCAWSKPDDPELETIMLHRQGNAPFHVPRRWSLAGFEWAPHRGGIACFGGGKEVLHFVTLPQAYAQPVVLHITNKENLIEGKGWYLRQTALNRCHQKF
jgi:hypothetical protein